MSLIVDGGRVMDGSVTVTHGADTSTQIVAMATRKQQTVAITTDKALTYDVYISMNTEDDADFVKATSAPVALIDGATSVVNYDYSCNFMKLVLHGGVADSLPVVDILTQPNAQ